MPVLPVYKAATHNEWITAIRLYRVLIVYVSVNYCANMGQATGDCQAREGSDARRYRATIPILIHSSPVILNNYSDMGMGVEWADSRHDVARRPHTFYWINWARALSFYYEKSFVLHYRERSRTLPAGGMLIRDNLRPRGSYRILRTLPDRLFNRLEWLPSTIVRYAHVPSRYRYFCYYTVKSPPHCYVPNLLHNKKH